MSNSNSRVRVGHLMAYATLAMASVHAHAVTVDEITETNKRVKSLEALAAEKKAQAELDKYGGAAVPASSQSKSGFTPERTLDDGVTLLSVTGPSTDPTYLVQYRGMPLPLKVGGDAMDGWQLDAVKGNRLLLVRREGRKQQIVERKTVTMTDLSYASQREQQRLDAAKMSAGAALSQGGPMAPFMMGPGPTNQVAEQKPTP